MTDRTGPHRTRRQSVWRFEFFELFSYRGRGRGRGSCSSSGVVVRCACVRVVMHMFKSFCWLELMTSFFNYDSIDATVFKLFRVASCPLCHVPWPRPMSPWNVYVPCKSLTETHVHDMFAENDAQQVLCQSSPKSRVLNGYGSLVVI